jgi:hypothetical protein
VPQDISVQDLIRQEATKQGVPPELALSVAEQESGFNPTSIGPEISHGTGKTRAIGTFQLLPETAKSLGVDPNDPVQNVSGGVKYLRQLLDQHQGDLSKVLATYGGVRTNQTYVPEVMARMSKFSGSSAAPPPKQSTSASSIAPSSTPSSTTRPPSSSLTSKITDLVSRFAHPASATDPQTAAAQQDAATTLKPSPDHEILGGMVGAAAATMVAPELELPALISRAYTAAVPLVGAYVGGATQTAASGARDWPTIQSAGRRQMYYDAAGQVMTGVGQAFGRRIAASGIGNKVREGLFAAHSGMREELNKAIDVAASDTTAARSRLAATQSPVTPSRAGQMVEGVAQGPAKDVKDQLGKNVLATAQSGPRLPTAPLVKRAEELSNQITPMASHEPAALETVAQASEPVAESGIKSDLATRKSTSGALTPAELKDLLAQSTGPDHPLPGVLSDIYQKITENPHIEFDDAHKMKRLLDEAVNWDSPAKKQVQQITKGFRVTLRDLMAAHEPYNQATSDYAQVAKLYEKGVTPKLHKAILDDPEVAVRKIDWQHPTQARLLKNLTVDVPKQGTEGGAQQGEAAWNALRASWTHEKLVRLGPEKMLAEMQKMEGSGNGQEFIKTMYGDPAGQTVWGNLKQIGAAFQSLQQKELAAATEKKAFEVGAAAQKQAFEGSTIATAPSAATATRDIAYGLLVPGHPITKVGAVTRSILKGPRIADLTQWAAYTPQRTQWLIKALTGPEPGMALADLSRLVFPGRSEEPAQPVGPPPKPASVQASIP